MSRLIAVEGTDGSGKSKHVAALRDWLVAQGFEVAVFDFPRYGQASAVDVERYLRGEFGPLPGYYGALQAAQYYAKDRRAAMPEVAQALQAGQIVLCNRYVGSNLAHQGGKIADRALRRGFYGWLETFEYETLGIVRPSLTLVLRMPTEQAQAFVDQKPAREYLQGKQRDIHEADLGHLTAAARSYLELCRLFPDCYELIECVDEQGRLESIVDINAKLRRRLAQLFQFERGL